MIEKVTGSKARSLNPRTINRLAEADALIRQVQRGGATPAAVHESRGIILVRNESGADRQRFEVLGINGPVIRPTDNPARFYGGRIAVKGVIPTATHLGRFVVLLGPLRKNATGRAYASGVFTAPIEMADESHRAADVNAGNADFLLSSASGSAQLLYIEPVGERTAPTVARCIVRLGGGGLLSKQYALITAVAGQSPPYRYSAEAAVMDIDGNWSAAPGGQAYVNVFNLEEQGTGGQWVNPLNIGDAVSIAPAPGGADAWVCERSHYRGAY